MSETLKSDEPATRGEWRNLLLFAGCVGMQYLAAPVMYVGATHAALLDELKATSAFANSPEVLFMVCAAAPVFVSLLFPGVRWLKPLLSLSYLGAALGTGLVAIAVLGRFSGDWVRLAVLAQAVLTGLTIPTAITLVWEAMARGVRESRRGAALALAYGGGPLLAAVGAILSELLLKGELFGWRAWPAPEFPNSYGFVFLFAVLPMLTAAVLATLFRLPNGTEPGASNPATNVGTAGGEPRENPPEGLALGGFVRDSLLLKVAVVTVLLYAGNTIMANLTLYNREVQGAAPTEYVMEQFAARFLTKAVAGFALGLLLAGTSPRAGLLATGLVYLGAPLYAAFASGFWYLLTFPLYGAGELVGVYAPNYLLSASRPGELRRNMAISNLLMVPAAPLGLLFGWVADRVGQQWGQALGFQVSFLLC
ncbi:MAG: hypothetical protein ACKOJF_06915, partial [Planctomycetaceae bacterium]